MSEQTADGGDNRAFGNQLASAVSPYLLQHRDNPVHWREWSPETLGEAKALDRPILLSIGYAACHWCHVMAHESFEDEATAAVMNRLFVNVKLDREERPDIDGIYMTALQAMGEQGGWPMTMFLTPKGEPFFGGTYYPPRPAHGRPSFVQVLEAVASAWENRRVEIERSAGETRARLTEFLSASTRGSDVPFPGVAQAAIRVGAMLDMRRGGLNGAPKFPNAPYLELVARGAFPNGEQGLADGFLLTLRGMAEGGIYDHLGGGLSRYSVDDRWLVPHFEKMLYDNAQFLRHLGWGWRATGSSLFRRRIQETVDWLFREMRVGEGAFAASLDADSLDSQGHSHEGAFYVWREDEIDAVLGLGAADFKLAYGVGTSGNFEGKTILNRLGAADGEADPFEEERAALLARRDERPRPARDDKVLADWNGLVIRALAEIAVLFDDMKALEMARAAFADVLRTLTLDGRLRHAGRDNRAAKGFALSSDYGALIAAALQLFAATGEKRFLDEGRRLAAELDRWHGDGDGGHYLTASDGADVILRPRGDTDDATPGGTALVVEGLALLAEVTGDAALQEGAERAARGALARTGNQGAFSPGILNACDSCFRASQLVVVGVPTDPARAALRDAAAQALDIARLDITLMPNASLAPDLPVAGMKPERYPAAYLCANRACRPPVHEAESLRALLVAEGRKVSIV